MANPRLKTYNGLLIILHCALAIACVFYFQKINAENPNDAVKGIELSIRDHSLDIVDRNNANWKSVPTSIVPISTVQNLLVWFFVITAVFHLIYYATHNGLYGEMIGNGNNFLRWLEYSITSTMMLYIIALISGVKDVNVYKSLFALNIAMIYTGQIVEERIQRGEPWIVPMFLGFMFLITEFLIIVRDFQSRIAEVKSFADKNPDLTQGRTIPDWIKYMIWVLFLFFSSFGFISLYGAFSNAPYERVESLYLLFSLLAKATLAGFIAYGTSQRQAAQNRPFLTQTPTPTSS